MSSSQEPAGRFMRLFSDTYSLLHRRGYPMGLAITPESRALLLHLAWSGPLTIGDLAVHTRRTQSVVSESVAALESHGLLARVRDPRDRRRTLVWLSDQAREWLAEEQDPLDRERLAQALAAMNPTEVEALLDGLESFLSRARQLPITRVTRDENGVASLEERKRSER